MYGLFRPVNSGLNYRNGDFLQRLSEIFVFNALSPKSSIHGLPLRDGMQTCRTTAFSDTRAEASRFFPNFSLDRGN